MEDDFLVIVFIICGCLILNLLVITNFKVSVLALLSLLIFLLLGIHERRPKVLRKFLFKCISL